MAAGLKDGRSPRPGVAAPDGGAALPAYFSRLSARAQRIYLASNAIERLNLSATPVAREHNARLLRALEAGAPAAVQRAAQALLDELCQLARLGLVQVEVMSVRPHNARGELHGIFYPRGTSTSAIRPSANSVVPPRPLIVLWMRTAQRHDVVKPRTFLRTLMHEFGHYLDYALLRLGDSPHTTGFFKRESFLVRMLGSPPDDHENY